MTSRDSSWLDAPAVLFGGANPIIRANGGKMIELQLPADGSPGYTADGRLITNRVVLSGGAAIGERVVPKANDVRPYRNRRIRYEYPTPYGLYAKAALVSGLFAVLILHGI